MAAYLANVGANAAHPLRSRLHSDGSFTLMPIPEPVAWAPPMIRFADLDAGELPRGWAGRAAHLDPDLDLTRSGSPAPTYGDSCGAAGRALSLRRAQPGDLIVFAARLCPAGASARLHLAGVLEVAEILAGVRQDPGPGWWDGNAHVRRARATGAWNGFWVFRGSPRSRLFEHAVPLTRELADRLLPVAWRPARTEQQTIASHTRAIRRLTGAAEELLRGIAAA